MFIIKRTFLPLNKEHFHTSPVVVCNILYVINKYIKYLYCGSEEMLPNYYIIFEKISLCNLMFV